MFGQTSGRLAPTVSVYGRGGRRHNSKYATKSNQSGINERTSNYCSATQKQFNLNVSIFKFLIKTPKVMEHDLRRHHSFHFIFIIQY